MKTEPKKILILSASDPTGGGGMQLDIRIAAHVGFHPIAIPSLLTAQSSSGLKKIYPVNDTEFAFQLSEILDDIKPDAIKIGAIHPSIFKVIEKVLDRFPDTPFVFDPIIKSSLGTGYFIDMFSGFVDHFLEICQRADLLTPNLFETFFLFQDSSNIVSLEESISGFCKKYKTAVLVKGIRYGGSEASDILYKKDASKSKFSSELQKSGKKIHGSGSALSTLIACNLAKGKNINEAVESAKLELEKLGQNLFSAGKAEKLFYFFT